MLSLAPIGAPFKGKTTHVYGSSPLEKVKKSIWLFIKVFVWIYRIAMGRKRKLKKVCYDWIVQEQNVVAPDLTIEKQNVATLELAIEEPNVVAPKLAIEKQNVVAS